MCLLRSSHPTATPGAEQGHTWGEPSEGWLAVRTYFAERPTSQVKAPTTAKNTTASHASDAARLAMISAIATNAAISHKEAIARPHQYSTSPRRPIISPSPSAQTAAFARCGLE